MSYVLAVDLGTTYTAAAVLEPGARHPQMLGLGNRAMQIPSVLYRLPDGEFLVGDAAERRRGWPIRSTSSASSSGASARTRCRSSSRVAVLAAAPDGPAAALGRRQSPPNGWVGDLGASC